MKTLADRFRHWYEYERDCNAKSLTMLASVPEARRSAPEFQKAVDLSDDPVRYLAELGYGYALAGQRSRAQQLLDQLKEFSTRRYVSPYRIARLYVGLGEKDEAFAWLEKAYEGRDEELVLLKVFALWDSIRSDPRFTDLLRRVGLPP